MLMVGEPFVDQFRVQAKNKEEDCTQYKEDGDCASHGILQLSSGRSACAVQDKAQRWTHACGRRQTAKERLSQLG